MIHVHSMLFYIVNLFFKNILMIKSIKFDRLEF